MRTRNLIVAVVAVVLLAAGGYGLYALGMNSGMKMTTPDTSRPVLYWHDPMVPGQRFEKPGKSPFMDMQLVPVYADQGGSEASGVRIDPRVQQNLGVRTVEVTQGSVAQPLEAVGSVGYNERDVAVVQARSAGFLERLYVRAPLDAVRQGQALAELYVPDWVAAQEEYLAVRRMADAPAGLLDAARQRMRLAGMSDSQIALVERDGKPHSRLAVTAPISGVIAELNAREGMTVASGTPLFRINGLGTVWINAEVPESMAHRVRPGSEAEVRAPAFPERTFKGRITAILPEVNAATRTLKVRIEVANPEARLVPGMFARVMLPASQQQDALVVPSDAVIRTGKRDLVMVAAADGRFTPVEVSIGTESGGMTEIRKGLKAGDKVVVSGQFLIDSEASLKGIEARSPRVDVHRGGGKVERLAKDEITLSHGPIPSLQWPSMTMGFKPPPGGVPTDLKVGDSVVFETRQLPEGTFEITSIAPAPGAAK